MAEYVSTRAVSDSALNEWWKNVMEVVNGNPEFLSLDFASPISYISESISASSFNDQEYFAFHSEKSNVLVTSYKLRSDGRCAVFQFERLNGDRHLIKVSSFDALCRAITASSAGVCSELRVLLIQNCNLLQSIAGISIVAKNIASAIKDLEATDSSSLWNKWLHLLNFAELKSLTIENSRVAGIGELSIEDVDKEVACMQVLAGWNSFDNPLQSISWTTDYIFSHGNRSPPWRQVHSELGYLEIRFHDRERIIVTASKTGYFVTKGLIKDSKGLFAMHYDREELKEVHGSLLTLLQTESHHFSAVYENFLALISDKYRHRDSTDRIQTVGFRNSNSVPKTETPSQGKKEVGPHRGDDQVLQDDSDSEDPYSAIKRNDSYDPTAEYWQIQKLTKYLRIGNQTATVIATCALRDCDLHVVGNQLAVRDLGTLEILVNLLDTGDSRCIKSSLTILCEISNNEHIRMSLFQLDAIKPLVEHLADVDPVIVCLAAKVLANCAKSGHNRRLIRINNGLRWLGNLLKSNDEEVVRCAALALCSCAVSPKTKKTMDELGTFSNLARLLKSTNDLLLIPVVGTLYECVLESKYRIKLRELSIIENCVSILDRTKLEQLQTHCANTIFKCGQDEASRSKINEVDGLQPLVNLLDGSAGKDLLAALTGAIWTCAESQANVVQLIKVNGVKKLIALMENQSDGVLINIVGALGACARTSEGRIAVREANGISPILQLLKRSDPTLLINVTKAIGLCAQDNENMAVIDKMDGVRLLWSLLKSQHTGVQASAAWAISPCIENAKDAGEMVRSFVGGLELVVSLLKSEHTDVLASVCTAIAKIAKDEENLAVLTDHGVVQMLAKLCQTKDDDLRASLAEAVANSCPYGNNRAAFGAAKAVGPLARFLKSRDKRVHRTTAAALFQLSANQSNCVQMHEHDVVPLLLDLIGTGDEAQQEAAAGTLANIRKLALASDKATFG